MTDAPADIGYLEDLAALEALYGTPGEASLVKELDRLTPAYRRLLEASPFVALATVGPEGLDCSPRGDRGAVLRIEDARTLMLPDRLGNNRLDSLRNILRDPRVALMAMIPGSNTTMRVNGRARISADPDLLARLAVEGKAPRSVVVITIERVYFQCARAVMRAGLWDASTHHDPKSLPSPGAVMKEITEGAFDGDAYDAAWPERAAKSLW